MSTLSFRALLTVFVAALLGGNGAFGEVRTSQAQPDLSQWSTLDQLRKSTGRSLYSGPDGPVEVTWKMETAKPISSAPTMGEDGTLFVGSGPLYAVGPEGEKRWQFEAKGEITRTPGVGPEGTIYAVSTDSASRTGTLYAIEPGGTEKWRYETNVQLRSDPIVGPDGTIYVSSGRRPPSIDKNHESTKRALFAVGPEGEERWHRVFDQADEISTAIVGADGTVYVTATTDPSGNPNRSHGHSTVYAFDSHGKKQWSVKTDGTIRGTPVIGDEGMVYVGSRTGSVGVLHAIGPNGNVRWSHKDVANVTWPRPIAVAEDGVVHVVFDRKLTAIGPNGIKWTSGIGRFIASVLGRQGMLYLSTYSLSTEPFGPSTSHVSAVGEKASPNGGWGFEVGQEIGLTGPVIGKDNTLYVGTSGSEQGVLYAIGEQTTPRMKVSRERLHLGIFGAPAEAVGHTMTLTIRNEGGGELEGTVEGPEAASPFSIVEGEGTYQLSPLDGTQLSPQSSSGDGKEVTVAYTPEKQGLHEDHLTIHHNGRKPSPLRVPIKGGVVPGSPLAEAPWPTSGRDRQNTSRSPHSGPDGPVEKKWQFKVDGEVAAAPAIGADGTLYVGTLSGTLYAVGPEGGERWHFRADTAITSTPTIGSDGTVYVGTEKGTLYAFGTEGTQLWRFAPDGLARASAPALARDGTLYVCSSGGILALGSGQKEKWRFDLRDPGGAPAIGADGSLYVGEETQGRSDLYAVGPEGDERWRSGSYGEVHSSSVVGPDGTMYVSLAECGGDDFVAQSCRGAVEAHVSGPRGGWSYDTETPLWAPPALGSDGVLYVGSEGGILYAIWPEGQESWQAEVEGEINTSPVIGTDEWVFGTYETIYLGTDAGVLHAIEEDGDEKWRFETESAIRTSPVIGAEGRLYVGAGQSLYAIGAQ